METIRKKICFDRFISHRNGISPYIQKENEDTNVKYVDSVFSESNYNSFPCDFVLNKYDIDEKIGVETGKIAEISRLKYLDVLRWYNDINEIVRNGFFLKRIDYKYDEILHISSAIPQTDECGVSSSAVTSSNTISTSIWIIDNSNEFSMFDCEIVDSSFFTDIGNGLYSYNDSNSIVYENIIEKNDYEDSELSEDEENFMKKMDYFVLSGGDVYDYSSYSGLIFTIGKNDAMFVIDEYDKYKRYEGYWNNWWAINVSACTNYITNRASEIHSDDQIDVPSWEKYVFDQHYKAPKGLGFIYDFEKYVLGKIEVPEIYNGNKIEGSKVPNFVFYLNYNDYLYWFNENANYVDSNEDIKKEWERRGGDGFKSFLESITPIFINQIEIPQNQDFVYFDYSSPTIGIDFSFENDFYDEYSYATYEYSIGPNGEIVDGTFEYEKGGDNQIESALTPSFSLFTDYPIITESKLSDLFGKDTYYIDNETYGKFTTFQKGGKLFKCTCYSGVSSSAEVISCSSGCVKFYSKTDDNAWNFVSTINISETENNVISEEKYPLTKEEAYQVVGINEIMVLPIQITPVNINSNTGFSEDGNIKVVSSITNYNKSISKKYSWWECVIENSTEITCGDGEEIDFSEELKYRNLLLLSCVPDACETTGGHYYYMVKYDNGYTNINRNNPINKKTPGKKVFMLPCKVNSPKNIESYDGQFSGTTKYDMVTYTGVTDGLLNIEYVIGATSGVDINTSGIHYVDTYRYQGLMFIDTIVDNIYNAKILCEKISFDKKTAYSEEIGAYRDFIPSKIVGMEIGTQWTSGSSLKAYLYTDECYDNLVEYPNVNVDLSFNRGNAAAWEKHFKLSECNSFEDLENYGNGYFLENN